MEFALLGPLEVTHDNRPLLVGGGRRRALLALLLLHRNEVVSADRLIEELWDGQPPATAAKGLQVHISQLRSDLLVGNGASGGGLLTRANGYVLEVAEERLDIARFERAVRDAHDANADGRHDAAAERASDALRLWRGPPLMEFSYESFAQREIARLEELRLVALEERFDAELALGRHTNVVADLDAIVQEQPLRDRLRGLHMVALYRCGRRAEALEVYREGHRRSIDELGVEPSPQLRELQEQILAESPALAPPPRAGVDPRVARRSSKLLIAAGVLVAAAALAALFTGRDDGPSSVANEPLDIAANSAVGIDAAGGLARFALPLPGRPTDIAAEDDRLYAVSIDSSALTIVDSQRRRLARTIPLTLWPAAVAVDSHGVWIVDGRRGTLVLMDAGYERVLARATWPRARVPEALGTTGSSSTAIALAGGAAWVTDGSSHLIRVDARGRVTRLRSRHPLSGITAGAGAIWAISRKDAVVLRVDTERRRIAYPIAIVARPGSEAPAPTAVAASSADVWVLNANTATVTRIDARTGGLTATIALSLEQSPRDIAAGAGAVWVASFDGSLTRIPQGGGEPRSSFLGASLVGVVATAKRLWVTVTALDQQLPGGG